MSELDLQEQIARIDSLLATAHKDKLAIPLFWIAVIFIAIMFGFALGALSHILWI